MAAKPNEFNQPSGISITGEKHTPMMAHYSGSRMDKGLSASFNKFGGNLAVLKVTFGMAARTLKTVNKSECEKA